MEKTQALDISDDLIESAEAYLERLPKTPEQVIEHWARVGRAVSGQLTEMQAMNLLLGNCDVAVSLKSVKQERGE